MVTLIRPDLEFILDQIKIAEAHASGTPLFGPGGLVPAYDVSWGLRTVDGTYNNLLPGRENWGAADQQFPTLMDPVYQNGQPFDPDGPAGPAPRCRRRTRPRTTRTRSSSIRASARSPT